ncbi:hypothetical protein [Vibrio splendidus]|uniref:hypothetical protein n=1 Tax=Vibrio splendidus TaxID=29497 RepID=UPI003D0DA771
MINKVLLVGITIVDNDDATVEQIQVFGSIIRADKNGVVIKRNGIESDFVIPPDFDNIFEAEPGEYSLRSSGEKVLNPDFISTWVINSTCADAIEEYRMHGFRASLVSQS